MPHPIRPGSAIIPCHEQRRRNDGQPSYRSSELKSRKRNWNARINYRQQQDEGLTVSARRSTDGAMANGGTLDLLSSTAVLRHSNHPVDTTRANREGLQSYQSKDLPRSTAMPMYGQEQSPTTLHRQFPVQSPVPFVQGFLPRNTPLVHVTSTRSSALLRPQEEKWNTPYATQNFKHFPGLSLGVNASRKWQKNMRGGTMARQSRQTAEQSASKSEAALNCARMESMTQTVRNKMSMKNILSSPKADILTWKPNSISRAESGLLESPDQDTKEDGDDDYYVPDVQTSGREKPTPAKNKIRTTDRQRTSVAKNIVSQGKYAADVHPNNVRQYANAEQQDHVSNRAHNREPCNTPKVPSTSSEHQQEHVPMPVGSNDSQIVECTSHPDEPHKQVSSSALKAQNAKASKGPRTEPCIQRRRRASSKVPQKRVPTVGNGCAVPPIKSVLPEVYPAPVVPDHGRDRIRTNTMVLFCKRDLLRYQVRSLWKKSCDKKKRKALNSLEVAGKRIRRPALKADNAEKSTVHPASPPIPKKQPVSRCKGGDKEIGKTRSIPLSTIPDP